MNITPETKKLSALFGLQSEESYKIPEYQRNYSWREKQIETLFNDLMEEPEGYYLGNLLLVDYNDGKFDVIDGHQRLTTISLFLLAIYENLILLEKSATEDQRENLYSTTSDIKRMLFTSKKEYRLNLLENDNKIWQSLLLILEKKQSTVKYGIYSFQKRYKYIRDVLLGKLQNIDEIRIFYEKVINLELLSIKVNNLADAYNAFSSLNSKGLPLTQLDLLKVTYLKNATRNKMTKPLIKWDVLMSKFRLNGNEESDSKLVTQFLANNFDTFESTDKSSITKSLIISKYEKLFGSNKLYIDDLIANADVFLKIVNPTNDNEIDKKLIALSKLDISQAYPLLMYVFKIDYDRTLIIKILDIIINFYIRRNICSKPKSSDIRARMIGLVRELVNFENSQTVEIYSKIADVLKKISVDDASFKITLTNEGIYHGNYETTRYILIDLERTYGKKFNKENPDTLDEKIGDKYRWTVEHILPQGESMPDYWENALKPLPEGKTISDILEDTVHHIGNLTLTAYNSELSNHSFEEKKTLVESNNAVGLQNGLFLNRDVVNKEKWGLHEIEERSNNLADLVVEKYSFLKNNLDKDKKTN